MRKLFLWTARDRNACSAWCAARIHHVARASGRGNHVRMDSDVWYDIETTSDVFMTPTCTSRCCRFSVATTVAQQRKRSQNSRDRNSAARTAPSASTSPAYSSVLRGTISSVHSYILHHHCFLRTQHAKTQNMAELVAEAEGHLSIPHKALACGVKGQDIWRRVAGRRWRGVLSG